MINAVSPSIVTSQAKLTSPPTAPPAAPQDYATLTARLDDLKGQVEQHAQARDHAERNKWLSLAGLAASAAVGFSGACSLIPGTLGVVAAGLSVITGALCLYSTQVNSVQEKHEMRKAIDATVDLVQTRIHMVEMEHPLPADTAQPS